MFIHNGWHIFHSLKKKEYLGLLALTLSGASLVFYLFFQSPWVQEAQKVQPGESEEKISITESTEYLVCDVSGAVQLPGLVRVSAGDRVADAIQAAGGMSTAADLAQVSNTLNLAEKVKDGQKIVVPFVSAENDSMALSSVKKAATISLNTASAAELQQLNGIGPAKSQQILSQRPFQRIEELVERKILSAGAFEKISSQLSL
ncbi:helix-hairpin-helix domain-containing protein [Candidatus Woesebacteria bacterium]|nr:helix-hairpin-helix domain-containing protein [Candidatus Woesebacteria bacterium]